MKSLILACLFAASSVMGARLLPGYTECSVLIEFPGAARAGSGFLFTTSNRVFLVTAKHVLFNINSSTQRLALWDTNLVISGLTSDRMGVARFQYNLGAYYENNEVRYSTNHDVAVALVGRVLTNGIVLDPRFTQIFGSNKLATIFSVGIFRRFADVNVGEDIFTFGYPVSVGSQHTPQQLDKVRPLAKRGIISDKDPIRKRYVFDLPVYFGNSGGPVVAMRDTSFNSFENQIVAVVSEFVPFEDVWKSERYNIGHITWSNSGYSIAEPIDHVMDLLW